MTALLVGTLALVLGSARLGEASARAGAGPRPEARGVVVEQVADGSASSAAGLEEGDVLLGWALGRSGGELHSPFDLVTVETEQAPLGTVTLAGVRGGQRRTWAPGPGSWGLSVRPELPERLMPKYGLGKEAIRSGRAAEAAAAWRAAASELTGAGDLSLRCWLLLRAAGVLASAGQWPEADASYAEAAERAKGLDGAVRAQVLSAWAATFTARHDATSAGQRYREALAACPPIGHGLAAAAILGKLGAAAWQTGDLAAAEDSFRRALAVHETLAPGSLALAASLNSLGNVLAERGDLDRAEEHHRRALAIREQVAPESLTVAASLNNLGNLADDRGDLAAAERFHRQALAIREKRGASPAEVAASLDNLGNVLSSRGDLAQAEDHQRRALAIREAADPGSSEVAASLVNLGSTVVQRGDYPRAATYFRQALALYERAAPGGLHVARCLHDLGMVAEATGDLEGAESDYRRALALKERLAPGSLLVASTLDKLGLVASERGDLPAARDDLGRALEIREQVAPDSLDVAESLNHLGEVARRRGDLAGAEALLRRADALWERLGPDNSAHADGLAALAAVLRQQQRGEAAVEAFARALNVLESQTAQLGGPEGVRSAFRERRSDYYREYMELLLARQEPARAFEVIERSRAQTLLEALAEGQVDLRAGMEPGLRERERSLREALAARIDRRVRLLGGSHTEEQVAAATREIEAVLAEQQEVEGRIRVASPRYAALTRPRPLRAADIQGLLDPDTLLLEYALGAERSHLWLVSPTGLAVFELPRRSALEPLVQRLYGLVTARGRSPAGESPAAHRARIGRADAEAVGAAAALSRALLGPAASSMAGKRLVIVSDGLLHYVPFAALPEPATSPLVGRAPAPLAVGHEIVELPSASVLALLRKQEAERPRPAGAVAVLADPVFEAADPRVAPRDGTSSPASGARLEAAERLTRSAADLGFVVEGRLRLPRLVFSREEARAIRAVTPPGQEREALDFEANRSAATDPDLARYRVVHFATHGLLDSEHPELSGLVLSLVDAEGRPQRGFLDLQDVYNLHLPVEVVVLSACETALGKELTGEGLLGLARGFIHAGALRVVASLWRVDDVATADLMAAFHRGMQKEGLRPAAALRAAQAGLSRQKRWASPYFWAGFQIQGEWR